MIWKSNPARVMPGKINRVPSPPQRPNDAADAFFFKRKLESCRPAVIVETKEQQRFDEMNNREPERQCHYETENQN